MSSIEVGYEQEERIRQLLVGRTVRKAAEDTLELDDGTRLQVVPNEGGCACSAGDFELVTLAEVPNAITAVSFDISRDDDWTVHAPDHYRVFVYAEGLTELLHVAGDEGNGYYGRGYWLLVTEPSS